MGRPRLRQSVERFPASDGTLYLLLPGFGDDLALPDLQADSIATSRRSDTTAMKKILRALNGSKP